MSKAKRGGGVGNDIYDGAASFGMGMAKSILIFCIIATIVVSFISIYLLVTPGKYPKEVDGTVVNSSNCQSTKNTWRFSMTGRLCYSKVKYTVNGTAYTEIIEFLSPANEGQSVKLVYDPANPRIVKRKGLGRKKWAGLMVAIAVGITLFNWLIYYLANKYKFVAAAVGVYTVSRPY